MSDDDVLGPVSYLIVEFPGNGMTGEGLPILIDLVDRGVVRILDLVFVTRDGEGTLTVAEIADFDGDGTLDLAIFEGASSGLLDEGDLAEAANAIGPDTSALILLFENSWATDFVRAIRRGGAEVVSAGYVPHDALIDTLQGLDE